ncbi:ECF transporter S component [Leifsonia sp. H3M29-4]|uniref:ECF transporter S component n=1 Tax=Salinibacterium metalliresistens TaxID=3031321 RepID=UPI0023DA6723|nr:ECF transporter S component [Salinibacterium metalliresistens]MDF1478570.1 ECF transporter S component [Salinibacterium metalliresistens]
MTNTIPTSTTAWRVVDIVVAAVVAVACGVIFFGWNLASDWVTDPLSALLPGLQGLGYGVWLIGGLLTAVIVRKPGAALFGEVVAASVSALLGAQWGLLTLESGLVQGLAAELIFLAFLYRVWSLPVVMLAGAASGLAMAVNDLVLWYAGADALFATVYVISCVVSGAVVAGLLSWLLARGLARTGALSRFAAGREGAVRV